MKGLGEGDWKRIEAARRERPFASVEDFVRRTGLDEGAVVVSVVAMELLVTELTVAGRSIALLRQ